MEKEKSHICPVFPDLICPQGKEMSNACTVRISGNYDPMLYFRDHLMLYCALYQNQQYEKNLNQQEK